MMKHLLAATLFSFGLVLSGCGGGGDEAAPGPTTLQVTDTTVGTGTAAAVNNTLTVNYTGWLYSATAANLRGAQVDTSVGRTPFQFRLGVGQVIAGWDQGLVGMRVGGTRTLIIPSALAYGSAGAGGGLIPPNAALVFTVDLLAVQ
jgi:FKBP-type peptidyl-prolyl cis-trans isomerase FkpA